MPSNLAPVTGIEGALMGAAGLTQPDITTGPAGTQVPSAGVPRYLHQLYQLLSPAWVSAAQHPIAAAQGATAQGVLGSLVQSLTNEPIEPFNAPQDFAYAISGQRGAISDAEKALARAARIAGAYPPAQQQAIIAPYQDAITQAVARLQQIVQEQQAAGVPMGG
jgi:hypothetical protein